MQSQWQIKSHSLLSAVVVVKWSACSSSTLTIRVQILQFFSAKFVFKKNENNQKEAGLAHFFKKCVVGRLKTIYISYQLFNVSPFLIGRKHLKLYKNDLAYANVTLVSFLCG